MLTIASAPQLSNGAILPPRAVAQETRSASPVGFALFLLVNATLFLRPADGFPSFAALPIYLVVILACLAASVPSVVKRLSWRSLVSQPGNICVLAMLPAIVLSHLAHRDSWYARMHGWEFAKIVIYF